MSLSTIIMIAKSCANPVVAIVYLNITWLEEAIYALPNIQ